MVDYCFYVGRYYGRAIPDEEWGCLETQARAQLEQYKRVYTVTSPDENAEAMAVCAMAEAMYNAQLIASGEAGSVNSASIGSVSVSYGSHGDAVDITPEGQARELFRCACLYLDIYRGVG